MSSFIFPALINSIIIVTTTFILFTYFIISKSLRKARTISANHHFFRHPRLASDSSDADTEGNYYLPKEVVDYRKADHDFKKSLPSPTKEGYIVVGGSGFVGGHLVKSLILRGEEHVVNVDFASPKLVLPASVHYIKADITDYAQLESAFDAAIRLFDERGVKLTTVFMTAAIIKFQHNYSFQYPLSYNVNVKGTENVVKACLRKSSTVRYFIQTSTSHVSLGYDRSGYNITEDDPCASKPFNHYQRTKILAEKIALSSNDTPIPGSPHSLLTASIRPCTAIFGAHDTFFIESLFRVSKGLRPLQVLFGPEYRMDWLYVENLAYAFSLLEHALRDDPALVAGQVFNISNDEEVRSILDITRRITYFLPTSAHVISIPSIHITLLAKISDVAQLLGISLGELDIFSSAAWDLVRIHSGFSCDKAKKLLGYRRIYTVDEGIMKSVTSMNSEATTDGTF